MMRSLAIILLAILFVTTSAATNADSRQGVNIEKLNTDRLLPNMNSWQWGIKPVVVPGAPSNSSLWGMDLDSQGKPHIFLVSNGDSYSHWTGSSWSSAEIFNATPGSGWQGHILLDKQDIPRILYYNDAGGHASYGLNYAERVNGMQNPEYPVSRAYPQLRHRSVATVTPCSVVSAPLAPANIMIKKT